MTETNSRKFIVSSELFGGYEVMININHCDSLDDIVNTFYDDLYNCLVQHKFEYLINKVKLCRFHIHNFTFEDIILSEERTNFYICDHC